MHTSYDKAIEVLKNGKYLIDNYSKVSEYSLYGFEWAYLYLFRNRKHKLYLLLDYHTGTFGRYENRIPYKPDWPRFGEFLLCFRVKMPKAFRLWINYHNLNKEKQ